MRYLSFILFSFFLIQVAFTQDLITSGVVMMELTDVDSDDQMIASQLEMMKGMETSYSFSPTQSLVSVSFMGGMVSAKSLTEKKSKDQIMLMDMMGQKMMIESSMSDRAELEAEQEKIMSGLDVKYDKSDTKEILGFNCVKAMVGSAEDDQRFEMYVTDQLDFDSQSIRELKGIQLEGFPLEYTLYMNKVEMTYTVVEFEKEVDESVFKLNTEGYKKMTFEEFQEQMKGMGGMGF